MKKRIVALAVSAICLATVASSTLAYFTDEQHVHNILTSGGISIQVVETMQGEGDAMVEFPKDGLRGIMPGTVVSKTVQIQNTGANEAWIRVKVDSSIIDADRKNLALNLQDGTEVITYDVLDGWQPGTDGYFYYEKPVPVQMLTTPLFETVRFAPKMGNEYQNCTANIVISAQAVQTANNGDTVMDASGWPTAY